MAAKVRVAVSEASYQALEFAAIFCAIQENQDDWID